MRKLLWVGDAVCDSGFSKCTHEILEHVRGAYDVTVMGLNYRGEPHGFPYEIWPAGLGGDLFGVRYILNMCDRVHPDIIVIQNDPWNFPAYVKQLDKLKDHITRVGVVAVDAPNCLGRALNGLDHAIFWTQFGADEAKRGGYTKTSSVIPLGIDHGTFYPRPESKAQLRMKVGLPEEVVHGYIVGNMNRNQPRKRMDLTLRYFAEWVHSKNVSDAYLWLHVCPTGDAGFDIEQLAKYYGLQGRIILVEPEVWRGVTEAQVALTLNCFDVQISTTQGEGWGLTTQEGMACGIPQILPDWSALGEWARHGAYMVPVTSTACTLKVNALGGIADEAQFITALDRVYRNPETRKSMSAVALKVAAREEYRWENIGQRYVEVLNQCLREPASVA